MSSRQLSQYRQESKTYKYKSNPLNKNKQQSIGYAKYLLNKYFQFLAHFRKYRYFYLLLFSIFLLILVIVYAKKIFTIRQDISELIILHRSTYSTKSISKLDDLYQKEKKIPKQIISKEQIQMAKKWKDIKNEDLVTFSEKANQELQYYQDKYNIIDYQQQSFCLVVHNSDNRNSQTLLDNIKSILMQNYNNFHVIYVKNIIENETEEQKQIFKEIKTLLYQRNQLKITKKIKDRKLALQIHKIIINNNEYNNYIEYLYLIAQDNCEPEEIVMFIDSQNYLIGKQVLKVFNSVYQQKKYNFAYANFLEKSDEIGNLSFLFKPKMNISNLFNQKALNVPLFAFSGKILYYVLEQDIKSTYKQLKNLELLIPILQKVNGKATYIPEITYFINSQQINHALQSSQILQKLNDLYKQPEKKPVLAGKKQIFKNHKTIHHSKLVTQNNNE